MPLIAAKTASDFELPEPGSVPARCYRVIDLGRQQVNWKGESKVQHKVLISWELLGEQRMQDGRPFSIHKRYTVSLSDNAALRKDLQAWRGKPFTPEELQRFDLTKLAGAYCLLNVLIEEREGGTYANVGGLMPLPKGMPKPEAVNALVVFTLDEPDEDVFSVLSESLRNQIMASPEWAAFQQRSRAQAKRQGGGFDSLPSDRPWDDEEVPL